MPKNIGKVHKYLLEIAHEQNFAHLTLIDPDPMKIDFNSLPRVIKAIDEGGSSAFMLGGSTAFDRFFLEKVIDAIKEGSDKPIILFPGNIAGVTPKADALFFLSVLNSRNPYYIIGAQMISSPFIKKWGIETISLAYILVEPGGTAGFVSDASLIPRNKPELAVCYATAAELIGFDMVYLEAGSGADSPIPLKMIGAVRKFVDIPIIVGGGIKTPEQAASVVAAGATFIVQGTKFEEEAKLGQFDRIKKMTQITIETIKEGVRRRNM